MSKTVVFSSQPPHRCRLRRGWEAESGAAQAQRISQLARTQLAPVQTLAGWPESPISTLQYRDAHTRACPNETPLVPEAPVLSQ